MPKNVLANSDTGPQGGAKREPAKTLSSLVLPGWANTRWGEALVNLIVCLIQYTIIIKKTVMLFLLETAVLFVPTQVSAALHAGLHVDAQREPDHKHHHD